MSHKTCFLSHFCQNKFIIVQGTNQILLTLLLANTCLSHCYNTVSVFLSILYLMILQGIVYGLYFINISDIFLFENLVVAA